MAELLCYVEKNGIGKWCKKHSTVTEPRDIILTKSNFAFDDIADAADLEVINAEIANKNLFVLKNVFKSEDIKVEDAEETSDYGQMIRVRKGMRGKRLFFLINDDQDRILRTYENLGWKLILVDRANNIEAVMHEDGTVTGFDLATFLVESQTPALAAELPKTPVKYQMIDPEEYEAKRVVIHPSWRTTRINPITHVQITCSTVAANVFTLTARLVSNIETTDGDFNSSALTGLTIDSAYVVDQTGAKNTLASVVETETAGVYTVTGATLTSGSCKIVPVVDYVAEPAVIDLYESDAVALVAAP